MIFENIELALESLASNKMRAILTMLGIIIGITSVICIISIGDALTSSITKEMSSLGTTNIFVNVAEKGKNDIFSPTDILGSDSAAPKDEDLISEEQIRDFRKIYDSSIQTISYTQGIGNGTARDGKLYSNVSIIGVNEGYQEANNRKILKGRFINEKDIDGYKNVAVVSDKFVQNIFGNVNPLMKEIKVYKADGVYTYTVVGVYKYEKTPDPMPMGGANVAEKDISTALIIPVTTAKQYASTKNYSTFTVMAKDNVNSVKFAETIETYFSKFYRNSEWTVTTISLESQIETMTSMLSTISLAISIIAGISLLVGGIGVMNIMLVSVTERTREIGTRKALGAKKAQIRFQFVTEAMFLSLIGGVIGIALGLIISIIATPLLGADASFNIPVIMFCVIFSMAIGVFFGYYPANKAAKLDPIEALRYE